jgi:hypothetical protein
MGIFHTYDINQQRYCQDRAASTQKSEGETDQTARTE